MTEELRVTVVATGIGAEVKPDITLVAPTPIAEPKVVGSDFTPSAMPQAEIHAEPIAMTDSNVQKVAHADLDNYLDIPAFLRKQAD